MAYYIQSFTLLTGVTYTHVRLIVEILRY